MNVVDSIRSCLAITAAILLASCGAGVEPGTVASTQSPESPGAAVAGCPADRATTVAELCWVGGRPMSQSAPLLVLFGDSHAAHWWRAAAEVGRTNGFRVVLLTKPECPAPVVELVVDPYPECSAYRRSSLELVSDAQPDMVLVGSSHAYGSRLGVQGRAEPERALKLWREGTRQALRILSRAADKVLIVRDVPRFADDVAACMDRESRPQTSCGLPEGQAISDDARRIAAAESEAAAGLPNVAAVDFNDLICRDGFCAPVGPDGLRRYLDSNHLSPGFAIKAAPELARALAGADPAA